MKITEFERRAMRSIMEGLIPASDDERYPLSALDTGADRIFEEMLLYLPAFTGLGLRVAAIFVEVLGPRIGLKKKGRFSALTLAEREDCLISMSKKDAYLTRQLVLLLKSVACLAWCGDPRVRAALGHTQPAKFVKRNQEG